MDLCRCFLCLIPVLALAAVPFGENSTYMGSGRPGTPAVSTYRQAVAAGLCAEAVWWSRFGVVVTEYGGRIVDRSSAPTQGAVP